ncbi:MAG: hypothetical protein JWR24_1493 [Actinoallomurus sp.]|nr:hypothetical protein [Actinoallomurus sp.]
MSNGARHTWGVLAGVVLTAALAGLLVFGTYRLQHGYVTQFHKQDKWIGGGLIAGAAVLFGFLVSSRVSPLGSLVGGLLLAAAGALFFVSQKTTADLINRLPFKAQRVTLAGLEEEGFILFAGVGLLFASFFPSRWRSRRQDDSMMGYEYGLPEVSEPYGEQVVDPATTGRHAARDEQPASPAYGAPQTNYDVPLYEPRQRPYSGRSPFSPPEEGGGTYEMRRPE